MTRYPDTTAPSVSGFPEDLSPGSKRRNEKEGAIQMIKVPGTSLIFLFSRTFLLGTILKEHLKSCSAISVLKEGFESFEGTQELLWNHID